MSDTLLANPLNQVSTDLLTSSGARLENKVRAVQNSSGEKQKGELKKVAQEFEAVFIGQMLKVMRDTIEESGLMEGGFGKSIYTELFDQEVSLNMARHGTLGIADMLYKNLSASIALDDMKPIENPGKNPTINTPVPSQVSPKTSETSSDAEREISDLQLPISAPISSAFGLRKDPFSQKMRFHQGLDLAAPEGMKVVPALTGTVIAAGYENGFGNSVLIQHAGGIQTRYAHLASIQVKVGETVDSNDILGTVGNTGRSTGSHLHFEVIRMGKPVDPMVSLGSKAPELRSGDI